MSPSVAPDEGTELPANPNELATSRLGIEWLSDIGAALTAA